MKKITWILLITADIFFVTVVYSQSVNRELSNELLRLHVIANSNAEEDIGIKYEVRDKINEIIGNENFKSKEEVTEKLYIIEDKVNSYMKSKGIEYGCSIKHTISEFPQKKYNNITMPSGEYECIKAVLGKGEGENWWCIAYPPLCFTEAVNGTISSDGDEKLKNKLTEDTYDLIHCKDKKSKVRFFVVDVINHYCN